MQWFRLIVAWSAVGCLPPAAPWPPSDLVDGLDSDADADADADSDADVDSDTDLDDTAEPLLCRSLIFDAQQAFVSVGTNSVEGGAIYTDDQFTIELWAWFDSSVSTNKYTLVSLGDPEAWWLGTEEGDITFRSGTDELVTDMPDCRAADDCWHHVGVVVDRSGDQLRMYIDGERVAVKEDPQPMVQPTEVESLRFGRSVGVPFSWPTSIDEVRFGHDALLSGVDLDLGPERPLDDWIGVWRFNDDLVNEVTGASAAGPEEGLTYSDSCPF